MRLVCFECDPVEVIHTTGEVITLDDGSEIVTEQPSVFTMPRKLREVVARDGNEMLLECGHTRFMTLRFSGEEYE